MALYRKKPKLKTRIFHLIEYGLVLFLSFWINLVPFRYLHQLARALVFLGWPLLGTMRTRVEGNIQYFFVGDKALTERQQKRFVRKNLQHTVRVFLEVFQTWKFVDPKFVAKYVRAKNERSRTLFSERQGGVVGLEGHLGNWEIPIIFFHHQGVNIPFSAKRMKNPYVDRLLEKRRNKYGGRIIFVEESVQLFRELKRGEVVGLVADQDGGRHGIFVDFLGRKASSYQGPARLAYATGSSMVVANCVFKGQGHYEIELHEVTGPVRKEDYADAEQAVAHLTQEWADALAAVVEQYPEQYYWVHKRWRTRPPEEKDQKRQPSPEMP